jgi:hypothetical protein
MTLQRFVALKGAVVQGEDGKADHEHSDGISRLFP